MEMVRVIKGFKHDNLHSLRENKTHHNDQTTSVQASFNKDVRLLVRVIDEHGNLNEKDGQDLITHDGKQCVAVLQLQRSKK